MACETNATCLSMKIFYLESSLAKFSRLVQVSAWYNTDTYRFQAVLQKEACLSNAHGSL